MTATDEPMGMTTVLPARVRLLGRDELPEVRAVGEEMSAGPGDAFVFEAQISSSALDAYYTRMAASTLSNFARDAAAGVSLLDSHDGYKLGIGYSAGGRYEEEGGGGRAVASFYIVPGLRFGGQHSFATSDDYIRAIETRIIRDVSVGFYGGRWVCDLCGQPYFGPGSACNHLQGWEYEIERDGKMARLICTVTVHDARLSEVSLVYDGATPGAMILKAEQEASAGRMSAADIRQFERQYRVKLPRAAAPKVGKAGTATGGGSADLTIQIGDGRAATGGRPAGRGQGVTMDEEREDEVGVNDVGQPAGDGEARAMLEAVRQATLQSAAPQGVALDAAVRWLNEQLATVTRQMNEAQAEVARLQPLADQGRAYREELVNQAVAEGVRALGEAFPEETYRAMLANAPLEHIRQVRDTFAEQAAVRFPGGRLTQDAKGNDGQASARGAVPAAAYGAN